MINGYEQIAFLLERVKALEEGIQVTDGFKWKFCPADVIDRLQKLESIVFHKPKPASMMAMKMNLQARIYSIRDEISLLGAELEKLEKEYNEIHE